MTTPTIGPARVPTEWAGRLASLVHAIRPDWDEAGIRSVLSRCADRPLAAVTLAAVTAAVTRGDQRSPAIIAMTGSHWDTPAWTPATEPGIVTYCEHGEPGSSCPTCFPRVHHGGPPSDDLRARMRADIAAGREALASEARP